MREREREREGGREGGRDGGREGGRERERDLSSNCMVEATVGHISIELLHCLMKCHHCRERRQVT